MEWFRSYHGAPLDAKHVTVAKRSETQPGVSCAVWWALLDFASQQEDRGSIDGFNPEVVADFFGWAPDLVVRVVQVMHDIGLLSNGRIVTWTKKQPKREDPSTPRVRAFRERQKEDGNAVKRKETLDKSRVDKSIKEKKHSSVPATPKPPRDSSPPKYPHFPPEVCDQLYEAHQRARGPVAYARFRKDLAVLYASPEPRYTVEQLAGALTAWGEYVSALDPKAASFQKLPAFVAEVDRWVRLGAMPLVDLNGVTERGRLAAGVAA